MKKDHTILITFFSKDQARYLISVLNKVLGHGSENWTIRNRIMRRLRYGKVLRNVPVTISQRFDTEHIDKIKSAVTYAELRFNGE